MVFPSWSSVSSVGVCSGCVINIVYNKQLPLFSSATSPTTDKEANRMCRRPEELCTSDPRYHILSSPTFSHQLGDANLDGFPDLVFIVFNPSDLSPTQKLLFSDPCTKGLGGCDKNGEGRRGFQFVTEVTKTLKAVQDACEVSFFANVCVFLMVLLLRD